MRLRSIVFLIAGFLIGYQAARFSKADDPNVVKGPRRDTNGNRTMRAVSTQAQRFADQATTKSLQAIKRARGSLQDRMGNVDSDDAIWN